MNHDTWRERAGRGGFAASTGMAYDACKEGE